MNTQQGFTIQKNGTLTITNKDVLKDKSAFRSILARVEDDLDVYLKVDPRSVAKKDAEVLVYELHKNKLKNIRISRNLKNFKNLPEYWVRYHGSIQGSDRSFHRFKVPKDVVIVTFTYPGCPMFFQPIKHWESMGHVDASYYVNSKRVLKHDEVFSVPYVHGDAMPNVFLTTENDNGMKLGLYRRSGEDSFVPVDLETRRIWLSDLVYTRGPGVYYMAACMSVKEDALKKLPLVENLRNLADQAEKARKRKTPSGPDTYDRMHSEFKDLLGKHAELLKTGTNNNNAFYFKKSLINTGLKIYKS